MSKVTGTASRPESATATDSAATAGAGDATPPAPPPPTQEATAGDDGPSLSPREMRRAQRNFALFSFLNVLSFQLLTGNIIALYALRLGGSDLLVGTLYSFIPLGQLLPLVGRVIVRRYGTVRTMGVFWLLRYALMLPIMFAPLFANRGRPDIGIVLIVISVVGFNVARGVAITGHNSIVGTITTDADRGSFLARNQLIVHLGAISTGLATGFLLGEQSPLFIYSLLLGTGIAAGLASARVVFRFPEPPVPKRGGGFFQSVRNALRRRNVSRFVVLLAINGFVGSMTMPFLVTYVKRVHELGDNIAMFLTAIGSVGAIAMAVVSGFVVDRVGAKPLMTVFKSILTVTLMLVAVAPALPNPTAVWIYLGVVFFFTTFGANGTASAHSVYYYRLTPASERLNLGIFNFLVTGIPATLGALAGGSLLAALSAIDGLAAADVYRFYYGALVLAHIGLLLLTGRLDRLGAYEVQDVLSIFVSPRDLRALSLLHRLEGTTSASSQQTLIEELGQVRSDLAADQLLKSLQSPRFAVRTEALGALADIPVDDELKQALIAEVEAQPFTTAHMAADLIGQKGLTDGVAALRQGLASPDYFLAGKCMVALGRLGDQESVPVIEELFGAATNPRLLIHGATALELFGKPSSLPLLLEKLERKPSIYVRDEIVLSVAGVLHMADMFYPLYTGYLSDRRYGTALLTDFIAERQEHQPAAAATMAAVSAMPPLLGDQSGFARAALAALEVVLVHVGTEDVTDHVRAALQRPATIAMPRFRFLAACICAWFAWSDVSVRVSAAVSTRGRARSD